MSEYVVMLEDSPSGNCWLADGDGDPPRTLRLEHAKRFPGRVAALKGLAKARELRPFRRAQIADADNPVLIFDRD